ncbi:amino acid adenylation domain-containing protein [Myxococcus llanfairpwllgwyngyllgogerychwyrndrobwllllantysiliogogogochensis]|uniref:Amino acid adenylation domain-containing protein n=1 Tax=Myxococcus llanfairpwllgwyngyllgogerychwyrndrobwllllantysiliogogogochensis TaxID=2590453 RepID=A0A540WU44_9BACT|nr:non-ribosomal peptide synthetase [Myxococcus llanfairpwllgwyngyllgogerychwyrndrobwllllantysiliogogogochensis]TQF12531.1 amino acid adenylation domain-containing protein [Myxococcus llanfairpwllgwyngyllgogerychwyrndrobwllllantysiliogogogochensis]
MSTVDTNARPPPTDAALQGCFVFPASASQQRLWFLHELDAQWSVAYHLPVAFRVAGAVDRVALQRALNLVVARHEALRTRLAYLDGELVQVIHPDARVTLSFTDLGHVPAAERDEEARRLLAGEARRPFRFTEDSLLRVNLLRLGAAEHALLVTVHHLVADGSSVELLVRELADSYDACLKGTEPALPALPIQYADYVAWQRQWLGTEAHAAQSTYWKRKLAGAPQVMELPVDHPRPSVQTFRGATTEFTLSPELGAAVRRHTRVSGITPYMLLLQAFAIVLRRYTGQDDLLIGTPVANRERPELEPLIGFLANTLVVRVDLSGDPRVDALGARIRETVLEALTHQQLPFELLVEALQPQRTLSHNPLFQVMFAMQEAPLSRLSMGGHALERLPVDPGTSRFDLSFFLIDDGDRIQGIVEYGSDLFEADTIAHLVQHFTRAVEGLLDETRPRLSRLALDSEADRREQLARAFHAEPHAFVPLHEAVAAQAARTPERVAVECGALRLTYRELMTRVGQLAGALRARGVGTEDRVAVHLERSPDLIVALLAVLQVGGAYVPVDPQYPRERIRAMLQDARPRALVTTPQLASLGVDIPHVLTPDAVAEAGGDAPPGPRAGEHTLAYVLYTSGSTGHPKGVMVTHGALANFLHTMARAPGLRGEDVLAAVTTFSFDIAALELYLPLLVGARVVLVTREQAADARELAALLDTHDVTVMQATPATWRLLTDTGWRPSSSFTALCGGEALPQDLADLLTYRGAALWNLYGPTETTVWSCRKRLHPGERVTLGRPVGNTSTYVLDEDLMPVPPGVSGELFIGGEGVARGYWGLPGRTSERFVPDPFSASPGARLYRTGDLVRPRPDGDLVYLGRADHQVKLRGFRIELEEVETVLRRHPEVRAVAVHLWGTDEARRRLVAHVVPATRPPSEEFARRLREHARAHLPEYMVPATIALLDALPLTPNGKVDRRALPSPDAVSASSERLLVAPRTDTERQVGAVWTRLLEREQVGVDDDFFELGGNSLLAGRLVQLLDQEFGVRVPMRDLFINATIAHLATVIDTRRRQAPSVLKPASDTPLDGLSDADVEALLNDPLLSHALSQEIRR